MLITILTMGSRGDTQPFLALGVELIKLGHRVRFVTFENYRDFVKPFGLEFYPITGDVARVASSEDLQGAMQADNPFKILLSFNKMKAYVFELQQQLFKACLGSDVIVYHPGAAIGYFAAQQFGMRSVLATPFPMTPTREYPALIFYNSVRTSKGFNMLTHKIFEQIMWSATSAPIKQFWKKKFGRAPTNFACPYPKQVTRDLPTLVSCSDHVFPRPTDWPEHVHNTGFWFLEDDAGWQPPDALLNFLKKGAPPVYVGFGSMRSTDFETRTTQIVIDALRLSGQRGILATGWGGMTKDHGASDEIFFLESAPHSWLFPRMAAVVHHGGAGTTAAGLKAGVPGIIVPYTNDQFAWGRRIFELGVGARSIPIKRLTAEKLSDAINFVLTGEIKASAIELGKKIRAENGAKVAAKIIICSLTAISW